MRREEAEIVAKTGRPTTATASFRVSGVREKDFEVHIYAKHQ